MGTMYFNFFCLCGIFEEREKKGNFIETGKSINN